MKKIVFFLLGLILGIGIIYGLALTMQPKEKNVENEETTQEQSTQSANKNISMTKPLANEEISSPVSFEGSVVGTWLFEGVFSVKVIDENGEELGIGVLQAVGDWMTTNFVPFKGEVTFKTPTTKTGYLIFQNSNPSGLKEKSEEFKMPIKFKNEDKRTVKVFFSNSKKDPEMLDCTKVYEIEREIPSTKEVGQKALEELLKGPTEEEKTNGYFTSINDGVKLNKISITNGVASVDFDETLEKGVGGSCKTGNIIAQITQTLKQFDSVKEVKISIDGKSEAILQP